ncbi:MAG: hypothetical protein Q4Q23_03505 [Methanobacteriaceae archaeon]|nr:hypothetical protein [Methanobacteriaceae archaeon]
MSRILKIILFILLILGFFEVGLFCSYAIISSEPPSVNELIDLQLNHGSEIIQSISGGTKTLSDQDTLNITNTNDVGLALENKTGMSINVNSLSAKTSTGKTGNQTVTLSGIAYKDSQQASGNSSLVIKTDQTYSITATATGRVSSSGRVYIDTDTITVTEQIVLYNSNNTTQVANNTTLNQTNVTSNKTNNTTKTK